MEVTTNSIVITGTAELTAALTLNDATVTINPDGTYSVIKYLNAGMNTVLLLATDAAGNQSFFRGTINYTIN